MPESYLLEWAGLLLRWAHVIAGIAWIGASFYFIWLDERLGGSSDPQPAGALWFKWEAYWTWITGFALLAAMYYVNADLYLVDPGVMPLSRLAAIGLGLAYLVGGLAVYEGLCRSPLARHDALLSAALLAFLAVLAWSLTALFSGRGAFIHYGAVLGTIMAGNVAHVIIPGQRRRMQAVREGREPDAKDARIGRQRSLHNTYFALPAVFAMLANHYAIAFGHRHAWLVLVAMTLAGALIRAWFVRRHQGAAPWWVLAAGLLLLLAPLLLMAPEKRSAGEKIDFASIKSVIDARCAGCHAQKPTFPGIAEAPKGVLLEGEERVRAHAAQIHRQTVLSRAMPPGNLTGMSEEERRLLDRWYRAQMK